MLPQLQYTTILHAERKALGITTNEYCLCDKVQKLQVNPESKVPGWAYASREHYADFLGITKVGVLKMIERLCQMGLLEKNPVTKNLRVSAIWYEKVVNKVDQAGKQSLPESVNKVYEIGKQSLPKNKNENKNENKSENKVNAATPLQTGSETVDVGAKKKKKSSGGPGAAAVEIPLPLQTAEFLEAWGVLIDTPKWRKKTHVAISRSLKSLSKYEVSFAVLQVECAISGNWQGVVFPDTEIKYDQWRRSKSGAPQFSGTATPSAAPPTQKRIIAGQD